VKKKKRIKEVLLSIKKRNLIKEIMDIYDDVITASEIATEAGLEPEDLFPKEESKKEEPKKKKAKLNICKSKPQCACVDSSETNLTVLGIQKFLKTKGFDNPVDGSCNPATKAAIRKFQEKHKIECDSCVGDETEGKMLEVGLVKKDSNTRSRPSKSAANSSVTSSKSTTSSSSPKSTTDRKETETKKEKQTSISSTGGFSPGVTISIKSSKAGRFPPHSSLPPNYHGDGYTKSTADDAYIVNSVDFRPAISSAKGIQIDTRRAKKQFGNPVLRDLLISAAAEVYKKHPNDSGLATLWNVSKKEGGKLGSHMGHQSGLECDLTFYTKSSRGYCLGMLGNRINPDFDMERNCIFLKAILSSEATEGVLLEPGLIKKMKEEATKMGIDLSSPKLLKAKPTSRTSGNGHNDHYHIRCAFPSNSLTMAQYREKLIKFQQSDQKSTSSTESSAGQPAVASAKSNIAQIDERSHSRDCEAKCAGKGRRCVSYCRERTVSQKIKPMFKEMMKLGLEDLKQIYGDKFGYAMGLVGDEEPKIAFHNHKKRYYGASSPKTMLGLAQMIKYKGKQTALTRAELTDLLTYTRRAGRGSGSNQVNRAISGTFRPGGGRVPYTRRAAGQSGPVLGKIERGDIKSLGIAKVFGIRDSEFLWGRNQNMQSPRDMFKFFSTLQRMTIGASTGKEAAFYKKYKKEVDMLVSIQKKRRHSPRVHYSGVTKREHWGKGGRAMKAVSHTFVVDGKYVLSVYVDLGYRYGLAKGGDQEGYALLNAVLAKLLEKTNKSLNYA